MESKKKRYSKYRVNTIAKEEIVISVKKTVLGILEFIGWQSRSWSDRVIKDSQGFLLSYT